MTTFQILYFFMETMEGIQEIVGVLGEKFVIGWAGWAMKPLYLTLSTIEERAGIMVSFMDEIKFITLLYCK